MRYPAARGRDVPFVKGIHVLQPSREILVWLKVDSRLLGIHRISGQVVVGQRGLLP